MENACVRMYLKDDMRIVVQEALASKSHLQHLWRRGEVSLFYPDFHRNTDPARWADAQAPYPVPYAAGDGASYVRRPLCIAAVQ